MNQYKTIWIIALLFFSLTLKAQVITSEKSYLPLKNRPKKESAEKTDTLPPEIKIISPMVKLGAKYVSTVSEINLIGKATDENGISSIIVNSEVKEISEAGIFTSKLLLVPGDNEIIVISTDTKDNYSEMKYVINYAPPIITFADIINKESIYYGLIIGVNNYEDPTIANLDNPIPDAQKLYDVLTTSYNFNKENILFIKNAKWKDIIESLDFLSSKITQNDNLLIFYAGHGWWDPEANNGYWLPSDARKTNKTGWFRNSTLVDYLKEIKSKHTLLIADACFGGAIFKTRTAFTDAPKAIEKLYELPSRKAMTSGTLTEVPDRSAFLKYLVDRLESNLEKYLTSEQLFSSFRIAVINNSDVVPQYGEIRNAGDEGGDFIFIKK